jgi:arylsulfatase A-like enzyme
VNLLDPQSVAARKAIFGECFTQDSIDPDNPAASLKWRWIIEGNWKLIVPDVHNRPNDRVELYDLAADPSEEQNLVANQGERVKKMHDSLDAWWSGRPNSK